MPSRTSLPTTASGLPLVSSCNKLQEINDRINCLIHPDGRPSLAEMKKVVEAGKDADELYREAKALGEDILRRRDELDAAINGTLENYSPERVSAIDRAILAPRRLRTPSPQRPSRPHRHLGSHPPGGTLLLRGIPRFVNGVLAGISKTERPA